MKKARGEYRPIYTALWDGADFQRLSSAARFCLVALKGKLHATGIQVVPGVIEACSEWTGLASRTCTKAVAELEAHGWIKRERSLVWIVRGFDFEPTWDATNWRHRKHIQRYLGGLPTGPIVEEWRARYAPWLVSPSGASSDSLSQGQSDRLSGRDGQGHGKSLDLSTAPAPAPTPAPTPTTSPAAPAHDDVDFREDHRWKAFEQVLPARSVVGWAAIVAQWLAGERWGTATPKPTRDEVLDALLAAITAKDEGAIGEAFVRGCIERGRAPRPPTGVSRQPFGTTGAVDRLIAEERAKRERGEASHANA